MYRNISSSVQVKVFTYIDFSSSVSYNNFSNVLDKQKKMQSQIETWEHGPIYIH